MRLLDHRARMFEPPRNANDEDGYQHILEHFEMVVLARVD